MKDTPLFSITVVRDDSTGAFQVGDVDYAIHSSTVRSFFDAYGLYGLEDVERATNAVMTKIRELARTHK